MTNRLINVVSAFMTVWPFYAGALIAYDAIHHFWWNFWIMLVLSTALAVILMRLDRQRVKAVEMLRETRPLIDNAGENIQRLVMENIRAYAIVSALIGGNLRITVTAVEEADVRKSKAN